MNVLSAFSVTLGGGISLRVSPTKAFFAGVGALFTAAEDVSGGQETLVNIFERIENCFRPLEKFTVIPPTRAMTANMVEITVEVLCILTIATMQIKPNSTKKGVVGQTELEDGLQKLDQLTSEGVRLASAEDRRFVKEKARGYTGPVKNVDGKARDVEGLAGETLVVVDKRLPRTLDGGKDAGALTEKTHLTVQKMAHDIDHVNRAQLLASIRKWQSPPDPSTNYHIARDRQCEGTAEWFLLGSRFQEWVATGSLLWIHGKPGSGKSVLCSAIINHISTMCETGSASMAYFYFDKRDINKRSCYKLLSSLLTQLSYLSNRSLDILALLYSTHHDGARQPSYRALTQCLKDILSLPAHPPVYLIMDAIDECPNDSGIPSAREEVLGLIQDLVLVGLRFPNLHLCVTSREEVDIRASLQPLASHLVSLHDERGHQDDIAQYVRSVVYSTPFQALRRDDKRLVIERLSERADGMFRWVFCQFEMLRSCLPANVSRILDELPRTLDETYVDILMEIKRRMPSQARRLLHCLTVANRPLRVEELAELFALDFDGAREGIPKLNKDWRCEDPEEGILITCSGLVHIIEPLSNTRIAQFTHFSVEQFLTSNRLAILNGDVSQFHISPGKAHTIFTQACLGILLSGDGVNDEWVESRSPLAEYAARYWTAHAQVKNVAFHVEDGMRHLFDPAGPHFTAWLRAHDIDDGWNQFGGNGTPDLRGTPLYYASLCGFRDLVDYLIDKHPQFVITRGGRNHSPLAAALHKRHFDIAEQLLRHDANVDVKGYEGRTPLHAASAEGLADVAKWLLDHAADPNAVQDDLLTPLNMAAANGHLEVVQMLLERGAKVNATTSDRSIPLHQASENGHIKIVGLLIDHGADVHAQDVYQSTPLHLASSRGHTEIVRLLIGHGVDVNVRNRDLSTPLHLASSGVHETVPLRVEHGEEVNIRDGSELMPLHLTSSGAYETALLLIEHKADVNARDRSQSTPLHLAASAGLAEIVQLLIGYQADRDAEDDAGQTPFQVALSARHLNHKITTLLSEYRA